MDTYYSASATSPNSASTSCSKFDEIKLFPSGSKRLKILRACSAGVSGLTNLFSVEKSTVKCVSDPNTQIGCDGDFKNVPTSQYRKCSSKARNPTVFCLSIPRNSAK